MKSELQKLLTLRLEGDFYPFGAFFDFLPGNFRPLILDTPIFSQVYKREIRVKTCGRHG